MEAGYEDEIRGRKGKLHHWAVASGEGEEERTYADGFSVTGTYETARAKGREGEVGEDTLRLVPESDGCADEMQGAVGWMRNMKKKTKEAGAIVQITNACMIHNKEKGTGGLEISRL